jgi:hypothetical protein
MLDTCLLRRLRCRARQAALFYTGRHRAAALIAFWEFRDGIAGPVIPVPTLADQLPRFADPGGSYRLSADIADPGDLGVSLRARCWCIGRQSALQNSAATIQDFSTALPVRSAITEINSNDDLELGKCFPASAAGSSPRPQQRPS